jgi:hypothetical protein
MNILQQRKVVRGMVGMSLVLLLPRPVLALPPPTDLPEEYLRTKIILDARSPLNGEVLTAAEYNDLLAELEKQLDDRESSAFLDARYSKHPNSLRYPNSPTYPKDDPTALDSPDYTNSPNYRDIVFLLRLRKILGVFGLRLR